MNAEKMFENFVKDKNLKDAVFTAWQFGSKPNELAELVLLGIKTATASAFPLYEIDGEALPKVGDYGVFLDSNDEAMGIVRTSKVYFAPFMEVSAEHAFKEGEGDRSLAAWREIHQRVFTKWLLEYDLDFDENILVVCEEFHLVYPENFLTLH